MYLRGRQKFLACVISRLGMWDLRVAPCCTPCSNNYFVKSHCVRKPGRAKRWGSADFKDILVMQSLSHMNTSGRGLRNFICFLSQNDHPPPSFLTLMRPQTNLIKVNFERLILIISLGFLNGNFLCNLIVYSLMLWCKNILVFSRNSFFI